MTTLGVIKIHPDAPKRLLEQSPQNNEILAKSNTRVYPVLQLRTAAYGPRLPNTNAGGQKLLIRKHTIGDFRPLDREIVMEKFSIVLQI